MSKQRDRGFPERDAIVAFVRAHPGEVGTREIAREFGLKNADRIALKRISLGVVPERRVWIARTTS